MADRRWISSHPQPFNDLSDHLVELRVQVRLQAGDIDERLETFLGFQCTPDEPHSCTRWLLSDPCVRGNGDEERPQAVLSEPQRSKTEIDVQEGGSEPSGFRRTLAFESAPGHLKRRTYDGAHSISTSGISGSSHSGVGSGTAR